MHFWIDKRSQCAYTNCHRVPSSLSVGVGRGRGRVCVGRKGMASPLHRFVSVDYPPRRPPRSHRHYGPPPMPGVHARRAGAGAGPGAGAGAGAGGGSLYVEVAAPPQPTIASLAAARSVTPDTLLRTAALGLHDEPHMAPHLKFAMMVSIALVTVALAGAKYYFDRQVVRDSQAGAEVNVFVAAMSMACVCGVGCVLSLCRAQPAPLLAPDRVSSTARRAPRTPPPEPNDSVLNSLLERSGPGAGPAPGPGPGLARGRAGEAPPPYHIAVLLPPRSPPPPAYSALR